MKGNDSSDDLPNGWLTTRLGDVARLVSGAGFPLERQGRPDLPLPFFKVGNLGEVEEGSPLLRSDHTVDHRTAKDLRAEVIPPNSIVFAKIGMAIRLNRRRLVGTHCCIDNNMMAAVPSGGSDPAYLLRFLGTCDFMPLSQATTIPSLRKSDLDELAVPLPPLAEQKRIVAKVEELTARSRRAKEALDAVPPLLDQLRQSILAAAFRGDLTADWRAKNATVEPAFQLLTRIRAERQARWETAQLARLKAKGRNPPTADQKSAYREPVVISEFDGLPDIPATWSWTRAEEVCDFITKGTTPSSDKMHDGAGAVPFIKVYNLTLNGVLDFSVEPTFIDAATHKVALARSRVFPGDVLMNIVGPPLGKVSMVPADYPEWNINQAIAVFRPVPGLLREYLCLALLESGTIARAVQLAKATAGQSNLTLEICRDIPLPLPPEAEQREVVALVHQALWRLEEARKYVDSNAFSVTELDGSILAKAFRGELVPQDPNDEPASVLLERIRAARASAEASGGGVRRRSRRADAPTDASEEADDDPIEAAGALLAPAVRPAAGDVSALDLETLQDQVFDALWTHGALEKDDAVRLLAEHLRAAGQVAFQRLRADGPLYGQLLDAIEVAVKAGRLDRPRRGSVRACKPDASAFTADDWRHALVASLGAEPVDRDDALRVAAEWARDNLGLAFQRLRADGPIATGLRSALNSAIRRGEIIRHDATRISRATSNRPP